MQHPTLKECNMNNPQWNWGWVANYHYPALKELNMSFMENIFYLSLPKIPCATSCTLKNICAINIKPFQGLGS